MVTGDVGAVGGAGGVTGSVDDLAADLVEREGVLLLPGSQLGHRGNHFRIGFGREDLPAGLARFGSYLDAHLEAATD